MCGLSQVRGYHPELRLTELCRFAGSSSDTEPAERGGSDVQSDAGREDRSWKNKHRRQADRH